jgi:hypothetical protein
MIAPVGKPPLIQINNPRRKTTLSADCEGQIRPKGRWRIYECPSEPLVGPLVNQPMVMFDALRNSQAAVCYDHPQCPDRWQELSYDFL